MTSGQDRAETYLRLRVEAELRRVQALPRPDPGAEYGVPEPLRSAARLVLPFGRRATAALQPLAENAGRALQPLAENAEQTVAPLVQNALSALQPLAENAARVLQPLAGQVIGTVLPAADEAARRLHPLAWQAAGRLQTLQRSGERQYLEWRWQARRATATLRGISPADAGPEHEELSPDDGVRRIRAVAHALAQAGTIDVATSDSIVAGLEAALAARSRLDPRQLFMRDMYAQQHRQTARPPAGPYLAVPVGVLFPAAPESGLADVRLATLVIAPDRAVLNAWGRLSDANLSSRHLDPWPLSGDNRVVATDDRGNRYELHEDSGWSDDENWGGLLRLTPIPAAGIRWLDLTITPGSAAVRVDFPDPDHGGDGAPGPVPASPAELMIDAEALDLLRLAADNGHELAWRDLSDITDIVAALNAVGALEPARGAVGRLVTLAERLGVEVPVALRTAAPPGDPVQLPEPWRNLLDNSRRRDGPVAVAPFGAVLPELDGVRFVLAGLRSDETGADLDVMAWGTRVLPHYLFDSAVRLWSWSARDDGGRWHVAEETSSSASDQHADLKLRLVPPLHPDATSLEVTVAGQTGRATVTVPLDWRGPR